MPRLSVEAFQQELNRLIALLRHRPYTADELARAPGAGLSTVYMRLDRIREEHPIREIKIRRGLRGPCASCYSMSPEVSPNA